MTEPMLSVRNLRVEFPTRRSSLIAVDQVSFDIREGEILGVVGKSGAGKSTTASAIIGLLEPPGRITAGEVLLRGARIDVLPSDAMRRIRGKHIGIVFQDPLTSLDPLYRIGAQLIETIETHTSLRGRSAREYALSLLADVGIPAPAARIDNYPHQFSGGMRQRALLAMALAAGPGLVIVDEPTTALDVSIQAQIIAFLKRLSRQHGTAIMWITHDIGVISEAADRIAVMYAGRVVEVGPVGDVVRKPLHPYTNALMGSIPRLDADVGRLVQISGSMPRLTSIPKSCAFHSRCPHADSRCRNQRPDSTMQGDSEVTCWLHDATRIETGL